MISPEIPFNAFKANHILVKSYHLVSNTNILCGVSNTSHIHARFIETYPDASDIAILCRTIFSSLHRQQDALSDCLFCGLQILCQLKNAMLCTLTCFTPYPRCVFSRVQIETKSHIIKTWPAFAISRRRIIGKLIIHCNDYMGTSVFCDTGAIIWLIFQGLMTSVLCYNSCAQHKSIGRLPETKYCWLRVRRVSPPPRVSDRRTCRDAGRDR